LLTGPHGHVTRIGGVLSGPLPLLLRVLVAHSFGWRTAAALSTITGSALTRLGWVAAGRHDARRPHRSAIAGVVLAAAVVMHLPVHASDRPSAPVQTAD